MLLKFGIFLAVTTIDKWTSKNVVVVDCFKHRMIISVLSALKGQKTITLILTFIILVTPFMIVIRSNMDIYNGTDSRELLVKSAAMLRSIQVSIHKHIHITEYFKGVVYFRKN